MRCSSSMAAPFHILALDIEQIGYVYEGLLERTVVRAKEATLDLDATKECEKSMGVIAGA